MFINGRFLTQRITGVQRCAHEILRAAASEGMFDGKSVEILVPPGENLPASFEGLPVRQVGTHGGHLWEQWDLPRAVKGEILINLCNTGPIFSKRQIIMLYDAAVAAMPRTFTWTFRTWYQFMIRTYGRHAKVIGTSSYFSADEISRYFGISPKNISVFPLSGEHIVRADADYSLHEKFGLERDKYFLAVSSNAPNKNFSGILDAVARLPTLPAKFVIAGGANNKIFGDSAANIQDAIHTGYVTDGQLRALYEGAACFVYPSFYEGFGIPPLEAMECGCPVLVSRSASLPEICGDAALYCDAYDVDDIAAKILQILSDPVTRSTLREAGLVHARKWRWGDAARQLLTIADGL